MRELRLRMVRWLLGVGCRHPKGIICEHRQFAYDHWLRGYGAGMAAGERRIEAHWRGSVYGTGVYAGYPAPAPDPVDVA